MAYFKIYKSHWSDDAIVYVSRENKFNYYADFQDSTEFEFSNDSNKRLVQYIEYFKIKKGQHKGKKVRIVHKAKYKVTNDKKNGRPKPWQIVVKGAKGLSNSAAVDIYTNNSWLMKPAYSIEYWDEIPGDVSPASWWVTSYDQYGGKLIPQSPPPPPPAGGEMDYTYTDIDSFINLSDILEVDATSENQTTSVSMTFPETVDLAGLSNRRLYRNLTESQRANNSVDASIIGNYSGSEVWCLYDDLDTQDFHGFCPIGRDVRTGVGSSNGVAPDGDVVHIEQPDGTIGIKYSIAPTENVTTCNIDNFTSINGAPWNKTGHTDGTKTYTGGSFGNGYPEVKDKYSSIGQDIYLKEHASIHAVGIAHNTCGYDIKNTSFTNVNIQSSSENMSMFAARLYGPVVMENVNVTGQMRALNSRCNNTGLLFSYANDGAELNVKNCTFNMQNRGGRFNCGIIGGGMSEATTMASHLFDNVTINGYQNNEVWRTSEFNWGGKGYHGMVNNTTFIGNVRGNHTITMKDVTVNADVSHHRGPWGGISGYLISSVEGTASAPVIINMNNVNLNGSILYSFDGGTAAGCFAASTSESPNNNNPQPKTGENVYPFDPESELTAAQKENYKPPFRGSERNCSSSLGMYLFGTTPKDVTLNLTNFYCHGEQIFANEIVASELAPGGNAYINGEGPYYMTEEKATAMIDESEGGGVVSVNVASPGSQNTFKYWKPNNPSADATIERFNINDIVL